MLKQGVVLTDWTIASVFKLATKAPQRVTCVLLAVLKFYDLAYLVTTHFCSLSLCQLERWWVFLNPNAEWIVTISVASKHASSLWKLSTIYW